MRSSLESVRVGHENAVPPTAGFRSPCCFFTVRIEQGNPQPLQDLANRLQNAGCPPGALSLARSDGDTDAQRPVALAPAGVEVALAAVPAAP